VTLGALHRPVFPFERIPRIATVIEFRVFVPPALHGMAGGAARSHFSPVRVFMTIIAPAKFHASENGGVECRARSLGFMALRARNKTMLSLKSVFRAGVIELQIIALPAGRRMTALALFSQNSRVNVFMAREAVIVVQAHVVSRRIVAVCAYFSFVTICALNVLMLSLKLKASHRVIELLFIEDYDRSRGTWMFFMAMNALVFFIAVSPQIGLSTRLNDFVAGKAFLVREFAGVFVTFFAVIYLFYAVRLRKLTWIYDGFESTLEVRLLHLPESIDSEPTSYEHNDKEDDLRLHKHEDPVRRGHFLLICICGGPDHEAVMVSYIGLGHHAGKDTDEAGPGGRMQKGQIQMSADRSNCHEKNSRVKEPGGKHGVVRPHQGAADGESN
jgi:hypothetical protein